MTGRAALGPTWPVVGDRVSWTINGLRIGVGVFIQNAGLYKDRPVWHVRQADGTLVVLLAANGDEMRPIP